MLFYAESHLVRGVKPNGIPHKFSFPPLGGKENFAE
jgi:hypothetical protein